MSDKYLGQTGFAHFWARLRAVFAKKSELPTKVSDLTNDSGYINSVTDNDPTLAWGTRSKVGTVGGTDVHVTMPAKPTYTAQDVGAVSTDNVANNLETMTAGKVLDARQGRALKNLIDQIPSGGSGDNLGFYIDAEGYVCQSIAGESGGSGGSVEPVNPEEPAGEGFDLSQLEWETEAYIST